MWVMNIVVIVETQLKVWHHLDSFLHQENSKKSISTRIDDEKNRLKIGNKEGHEFH